MDSEQRNICGGRSSAFFIAILAVLCFFFMNASKLPAYAETGPEVTVHTQSEIREYIRKNNAYAAIPTAFDVMPVKNTKRGALSDAGKRSALAMVNGMRYAAGLDEVTLSDEQGNLAQAAAFVSYSIGELTHTPAENRSKPASMSDTDWNDGVRGCCSSNLACGYGSLNTAVLAWSDDSDGSNISKVGHRRWLLNPSMGTAGFGAADGYYAMYAVDMSGRGTQTGVAWPARNMPVEYFHGDEPWSISVGQRVTKENVAVTLTRISDGKVWTFRGTDAYEASDSGKYFNVDNDEYGKPGCIIFRPDGVEGYNAGDRYMVEITGAADDTIRYSVTFFDAVEETAVSSGMAGASMASDNDAGRANGVPGTMLTTEDLDAAVAEIGSDELKGSPYHLLQFKSTSQSRHSVKLSWKKMKGAKKYIIYGNRCGKKYRYKKIAVVSGSDLKVNSAAKKKIKKGSWYKFLVFAADQNDNILAASKTVHVCTAGGKYTNVKSLKLVSAKKTQTALKKLKIGKKYRLKIHQTRASGKRRLKTHRGLRYESSDSGVASVSNKGVVRGKRKGICHIYVYAQSGVRISVKVNVR